MKRALALIAAVMPAALNACGGIDQTITVYAAAAVNWAGINGIVARFPAICSLRKTPPAPKLQTL